jgi:hypothetical protein
MSSCNKKLTFQEKELIILRNAIDNAQNKTDRKIMQNPQVKKIIAIVEKFLQNNRFCCYGGTAINNILPKEFQFYNKELEMPDYDFFSPNALKDAKRLADIYFKAGFTEVEAKSGIHHGTFKVFVNFIPVADITQMDKKLFNEIYKTSIPINKIHYAPPDYLRMAAYLELSRPAGDVSRWEKVLKRVSLLNKFYPLKHPKCNSVEFQRSMENTKIKSEDIFSSVRDFFISQNVIFIGGYANTMYSKYMDKKHKTIMEKIPDFDILSINPEKTIALAKEYLKRMGFKNISSRKQKGVGEIIAPHYELLIDGETIAFIYKPLACHSYNIIRVGGRQIRIGTIDTMLSLYLAFIYADRDYYNKERILCMSQFLFNVQQRNRLTQKGLLKRFSINCYGKQQTIEDMRNKKTEKFKELSKKRNSLEYEEWFLRYIPADIKKHTTYENKITNKKHNNKKSTNNKYTNKKYTNKKSTNKKSTNKKSTNKKSTNKKSTNKTLKSNNKLFNYIVKKLQI